MLLHSLACSHPLIDGTKRLAWPATFVFLDINGSPPITSDDEVGELVMAVAEGTLSDVDKVAGRLAAGS